MNKILFIVVSLFLVGFTNLNLFAQIQEVRIGVDGMYWSLWAFGVKKALKRLDGVQNVKVSLETQSAQIILKAGELLHPKRLIGAIKKADFTAGKIHIKAQGAVARNSDKETSGIADLVFTLPDSGQIFLLAAAKESGKKQPPETPDLLPKLHEVFKTGKKKFSIVGEVHEHQKFPIGLTVEEFEAIDENR